jgi:HK97 family phage portal protein
MRAFFLFQGGFLASIRQRASTAWRVFRHGLPRLPDRKATGIFLNPLVTGTGTPQWHTVDFTAWAEEGFAENSLIYSAIMYKVRSKMSAPLRAYGGDPRAPEELAPDHPLSRLVARPNPHQSGIEFNALAEVYFNLGNFYGLLVRPQAGGLPERMYCLRPDRVYVVPAQGDDPWERSVAGVPEGESIYNALPVLAEDMMHVKLPNPSDPLEGLGEGQPPVCIARSADVDNEVTRFLKIFFENGAMMQGILKYDIPLDDDSVAMVKERWKQMYGGVDNWTEIGVLDQAGSYQRIGLNFDEMGFDAVDERNESRILGPLGVPPILIGTRTGLARSTYSNYAEARRAYWEDTAIPEQTLFQVEYQYYLQTDDGGFVRYDRSGVPALQQDVPALADAAHKMWTMGVPAQQAFNTVGLQVGEVPGGDVAWLPMTLMPAGSLPTEETQDTTGAMEAEEDVRKVRGNGHFKQVHHPVETAITCPVCGDAEGADCYPDHGGLCVCRACGVTFDPEVERV